METVSDLIGNDYQNWRFGDIVTISTPTGSGKTTFILKTLLDWAISHRNAILYLVNRKVLKEQIQWRINTEVQAQFGAQNPSTSIDHFISVWTYQAIEEQLQKQNHGWLDRQLSRYAIVVYDECHYFCVDATFNPASELSWQYLTSSFGNRIQIFMSATIESMQYFLSPLKDPNRKVFLDGPRQITHAQNKFVHEYPGPDSQEIFNMAYDYIDLHWVSSEAELPLLIEKADKHVKWLIFVDSINKGRELCKKLETTEKDNVIFINARYKNDLETYERILELKLKASISKRIVIATSVMDNGISFRDRELQNIVVFADTKESFIQMLGRKRKDDERVNLYICKRDSEYFSSRIRDIDVTLNCYRKYEEKIKGIYMLVPPNNMAGGEGAQKGKGNTSSVDVECQSDAGNHNTLTTVFNWQAQDKVLSDILNNEKIRSHMRKFCFFYNGVIHLSQFSLKRLCDLRLFYMHMVEELQKDEDAFLKEQAQWIGFDSNMIEFKIAQSTDERDSNAISHIREIIDSEYLGVEMSKSTNIDMVKKIATSVRILLTAKNGFNEDDTGKIKTAVKGDRTFTPDNFNLFMSRFPLKLPYKMEKVGQSDFLITSINP